MSDAAQMPNPADFLYDDQEGKYEAVVSVTGRDRLSLLAPNLEAARGLVQDAIERDGLDLTPPQITEIDIVDVRPKPRVYLVMRDGERMRVSHLQPGDTPREPNADMGGF